VIRLVSGVGVTVSGIMTVTIVASMLWPLGRGTQPRRRR
jgi:hypothetical protein